MSHWNDPGQVRDAAEVARNPPVEPVGARRDGPGRARYPKPESVEVFFRATAATFSAGIPLHRALQVLGEQFADPVMADVCRDLVARLGSGASLSKAMADAGVFSRFQVRLAAVGEESGSLHVVLSGLAESLEKSRVSGQALRSALTYPLFVLILCTLLLVFGLPSLMEGHFQLIRDSGVDPPALTELVMGLSSFARSPGLLLLLLTLAVLGPAGLALLRRRSDLRRRLLRMVHRLPLVGAILRASATARFARALAMLMNAGISVLAALPLAASVSDLVIEEKITPAVEGLKAGLPLDQSLARTNYFPPLFVEILRVGQETGFPAKLLNWLASQYEQELDYSLEAFRSSLEPLLMAFVGVLVGLVLVAALLPTVEVFKVL